MTPIAILHRTADEFICLAYYGGHSYIYKPYGTNLYYYNVNSLYPYAMKDCPMSIGVAKWNGNGIRHSLDGLYGFIEAHIKCPNSIKNPFLPYRDENSVLNFPTGEFVGFYYSEELKYAQSIYRLHSASSQRLSF